MHLDTFGNEELLNLSKAAFLCSRKVPAGAVLRCFDWAVERREQGYCVISGFHSTIEKDVLHYLLKGSQPIIVALHRGIGPTILNTYKREIEQGRMLILSPFEQTRMRGGKKEATIRNRLMVELADEVVVGYASPNGTLSSLLSTTSKPVTFLS